MIESVASSAGRDEDFTSFYDATYDRLARLGFLLTGSAAVGEELAQDAFIQLYRRWAEVRTPHGWVRAAVVSGSRSWWRKSKRQPPGLDLAADVDRADIVAVRDVLDGLQPRYRTALVLRFFEDLPEREIAELMDCPLGTVKSLIHRGLQRMKEELS